DAAAWLKANDDIRGLASRVPDRAGAARAAGTLLDDRERLIEALAGMCDALKLDRQAALGGEDLSTRPLDRLTARLGAWLAEPEALSKWTAYRDRTLEARKRDLGEFVERLERNVLPNNEALPLFEMSVFEAVLIDMVRLDPEIGRFDGFLHS